MEYGPIQPRSGPVNLALVASFRASARPNVGPLSIVAFATYQSIYYLTLLRFFTCFGISAAASSYRLVS